MSCSLDLVSGHFTISKKDGALVVPSGKKLRHCMRKETDGKLDVKRICKIQEDQ